MKQAPGVRLRMRFLRKHHVYTVQEAAEQVGISKKCWESIEAGWRNPRIGTAIKIARLLETTVEDLFADTA